jgi:hypothetical protein
MSNVFLGAEVLLDDFQDHVGTQIAQAGADPRELDGDAMCQGVFQRFLL